MQFQAPNYARRQRQQQQQQQRPCPEQSLPHQVFHYANRIDTDTQTVVVNLCFCFANASHVV